MKITTVPSKLVAELEDRLAEELKTEINNGIIIDSLVHMGWTKIELPPFDNRYQAIDISSWVEDNCQGEYREYKQYGRTFVFKETKDATAFALKWIR